MLSRAVRIANVGGVEVRLDPSLLLLAVLIVWAFTTRFSGTYSTPTAITMATVGALLVVGTTFLHELAHAFEARFRGIEVEGITLLLFGGVTEMHAKGQSARDELAIAAVGPWTSLLAGAVFGLLATFVPDLLPETAAAPVGEVAGLLGWWNVLLAAFNIVPGAPLDGGRVLRALLWMVLGDRLRALRISVRAGQLLALGLIGGGGWLLFQTEQPMLPTIGLAAVLVVTGAFMFNAARSELRHAEMDSAIEGRTVAQLVGRRPQPLPADHPLDLLDPERYAEGADLLAVDRDGEVVGYLAVEDLLALHPTDRSVRSASELAEPLETLPAVDLRDDLHTLVERFQGEHHVVRLTRDGTTIGALTEREAARALQELRRTGVTADAVLESAPPPRPQDRLDPGTAAPSGDRGAGGSGTSDQGDGPPTQEPRP